MARQSAADEQVQAVDHLDNKPRQMPPWKPLIDRLATAESGLAIKHPEMAYDGHLGNESIAS